MARICAPSLEPTQDQWRGYSRDGHFRVRQARVPFGGTVLASVAGEQPRGPQFMRITQLFAFRHGGDVNQAFDSSVIVGAPNGPFADCVEEVANWPFGIGQCDRRAGGCLRLSGLERRDRDQLCELPEVLGRCGKEELVSRAQRAS